MTVSLTNKEAEAFSEFLKRAAFMSYKNHAASDEEAYSMQNAGSEIRCQALKQID